jgi:hypothetical protein
MVGDAHAFSPYRLTLILFSVVMVATGAGFLLWRQHGQVQPRSQAPFPAALVVQDDPAALLKIAIEDPSLETSRDALEKLTDREAILQVSRKAKNAQIRQAAIRKLMGSNPAAGRPGWLDRSRFLGDPANPGSTPNALTGGASSRGDWPVAKPQRPPELPPAPRLVLKDVVWQLLPPAVQGVVIEDGKRPWYALGHSGATLSDSVVRDSIAQEFGKPSPQIVGATPLLFEKGGRVWFGIFKWGGSSNGYDSLLGYDGKTWEEYSNGSGKKISVSQAEQVGQDIFFCTANALIWFHDKQWQVQDIPGLWYIRQWANGDEAVALCRNAGAARLWHWQRDQGPWRPATPEAADLLKTWDVIPAKESGKVWLIQGSERRLVYDSLKPGSTEEDKKPQFSRLLERLGKAESEPARAEVVKEMNSFGDLAKKEAAAAISETYDPAIIAALAEVMAEATPTPATPARDPAAATICNCQMSGVSLVFYKPGSSLYLLAVPNAVPSGGNDAQAKSGMLFFKGSNDPVFIPAKRDQLQPFFEEPAGLAARTGTGAGQRLAALRNPPPSAPAEAVVGEDKIWFSTSHSYGGPRRQFLQPTLVSIRPDDIGTILDQPGAHAGPNGFSQVFATMDDGTVFLGNDRTGSGRPSGVYRPGKPDLRLDLPILQTIAIEPKSQRHCLPAFDKDGAPWAFLKGSGLSRFSKGAWQALGNDHGLTPKAWFALGSNGCFIAGEPDREHVVFHNGKGGFFHEKELFELLNKHQKAIAAAFPGELSFALVKTRKEQYERGIDSTLMVDKGGHIWVSQPSQQKALLKVLVNGQWLDLSPAGGINNTIILTALLSDNMTVFVAKKSHVNGYDNYQYELCSIVGNEVKQTEILADDGMFSPSYNPQSRKSREGDLWFWGHKMRDRSFGGPATVLITPAGPQEEPIPFPEAIFEEADGTLWFKRSSLNETIGRWCKGTVISSFYLPESSSANWEQAFSDQPGSVYVYTYTTRSMVHLTAPAGTGYQDYAVDQTYKMGTAGSTNTGFSRQGLAMSMGNETLTLYAIPKGGTKK